MEVVDCETTMRCGWEWYVAWEGEGAGGVGCGGVVVGDWGYVGGRCVYDGSVCVCACVCVCVCVSVEEQAFMLCLCVVFHCNASSPLKRTVILQSP